MTKERSVLHPDLLPIREAYTGRDAEQRTVGGGNKAELPDELWRWTGVEIARGVSTRLI